MKTVNDKILDGILEHQVDIRRYESHLLKRLIKLLFDIDDDLIQKILARINRLSAVDITNFQRDVHNTERLRALKDAISDVENLSYKALMEEITDDFIDLSINEFAVQGAIIAGSFPKEINVKIPANNNAPKPEPKTIIFKDISNKKIAKKIVFDEPLQGRGLRQWGKDWSEKKRADIQSEIKIGFGQNESINQISKRLEAKFKLSRRNSEILTSTAITHIVNVSKIESYRENGIEEYVWVSTLDSRTSPICRGRDGQKFKIDSGIHPPAHPRCRSTITPVVGTWKALGITGLEKGTRSSIDGQVPQETNYEKWLSSRPLKFKQQVLGVKKGQLFHDGLSFKDMGMDGKFQIRGGTELTLKQLKNKFPTYFTDDE